MNTINRSALVVKPAQPFLDWLHRVDPTSTHLTLDDLRLEPTIYLLPEWETDEEVLKYLAEVCNEIFEEHIDHHRMESAVEPEKKGLQIRTQGQTDGTRCHPFN